MTDLQVSECELNIENDWQTR